MECLGKVLCCFGRDSGADAEDQSTDQITDLADGNNKQIQRDPGADAEDQSTDQIEELVDGHVFVLHKPAQSEEANVDIVFFHGLQLASYERAYRETWESSVGREGKKILWPKEWLGKEDFPNARILSVSYDSSASGSVGSGREGMITVAQAILMNLVTFCGVGKRRPVILVGHSLGGLVIKLMCVEAHRLPEYQSFVESILGVFFYATPHGGAKLANEVCQRLRNFIRIAPALQYLASIDDSHLTMLSRDFNLVYKYHKWKAFIASEVRPIKFGPFRVLVVDSTSANHDIFDDTKSFRDTDHFSICKPKSKTDQPYLWLKTHIDKLKRQDEIADIDSAYRAVREIRQNGGRTMEALEFIHTAKREIDNKLLVITRLLDLQIIPSLVPLLKSADAPERQAAAGWALDTILYHGGEGANQEAAGVVDGAVVNALVGMLNDAVTAFPAVFCLRQLTGSNEKNRRDLAAHESTAKKLLEGLYMSPPPEDQKHISEAAEEVLKSMNWMPLQGEQPSAGAAVAAAASSSSSSTPVIINYDTAPGKDA